MPKNNPYKAVPAGLYGVSVDSLNKAAIEVLKQLHKAGHEAYLVGGGVRDQLLGVRPKDFDVATSAHPDEVKALFRNCRLVGRRFRLAHVFIGRELIEVATFRATHNQDQDQARTGEHGMILRDNVYGSAGEDAIRRDFTVNAIYYDMQNNQLRDYCDGLADMERTQLRLIGEPEQRYREDPVRMLRAARFAAKLGFSIEANTRAPIIELGELLTNIPAARLFDEVLKLFIGGYAVKTFEWLQQLGLFQYLFPATDLKLNTNPVFKKMVLQALANTDDRLAIGKPVTPAFLYSVFLWVPVLDAQRSLMDSGLAFVPALQQAASDVVMAQTLTTSIPRRFVTPMREIWDLQGRLPRRNGKRAEKIVQLQRFRAAYDFLLLREECGEIEPGVGQWWTDYQEADEKTRRDMSLALSPTQQNKRKKHRKPKRSADSAAPKPE